MQGNKHKTESSAYCQAGIGYANPLAIILQSSLAYANRMQSN
jgi:hypothetical protein